MIDLHLTLQRFSGDTDSTLGILYANGKVLAFTLEDEHRDVKVMHETRVSAGTYEILLRANGGMHSRYLERFGDDWHHGMLWLQNVDNFTWIYMHMGIRDDHTSGCLLVGDGVMQNVTRAGQLVDSEIAYKRVYELVASTLMAGKQVTITILDEKP
jgi:hypothetical protein